MKNDYKIIVMCKNCMHRNEMMIIKGELRPEIIQCENCHCETLTTTICSEY